MIKASYSLIGIPTTAAVKAKSILACDHMRIMCLCGVCVFRAGIMSIIFTVP